MGRKSDRPTHKRLSAFEKLQSERAEKGLEEDLGAGRGGARGAQADQAGGAQKMKTQAGA